MAPTATTRSGVPPAGGLHAPPRDVLIPVGNLLLEGELAVPPDALGMVVFAHGSGSSRNSRRNQYVAASLRESRLGTLLFDLLTREEEDIDARTSALRFDIPLLAERLVAATRWMSEQPAAMDMPIGYFGASTGAAAALMAAAQLQDQVRAVVSRGGRPDLAGAALPRVSAATLLLVGGLDVPVIGLNDEALSQLREPKQLVVVPGASHLFEEPGKLEIVALHAAAWFRRYLPPHSETV